MDAILDLGCVSHVVQHDDWPPLGIAKKVGLTTSNLPIIMSFPISHAFQDDGLGMIWDSQHSCWMEPNVNEHERAMGFHTHTTHLVGLSKANKSHFLDPCHL